ncbi:MULTISPECIES: enhanced serine sensitivity protein SseB C-terminal domain-containing protein [unclassified Streptomyces]|uniref:enhanced serine sensitivity protein SseB C-terminal domain-containing protein n=1 Tax=unclassified Streptomyces TaxID=2593676 RepID=UPI000CD5694E|nr:MULTISPECIES: enhanced serine sensitivity protein SseB C-terminal domain-containing protein [unclassified Streptomyces]
MSAGRSVDQLRSLVTGPDRLAAYEELLTALAGSRLWMPLWHGAAGDADARYGGMESGGYGYAPCFTSERELAASGWGRDHEVTDGRTVASALYRDRCGLWLDPHTDGGGLGVPWLDLRRVAEGLDRLPAGPLRISEPSVGAPAFYHRLVEEARRTRVLRGLWRGWVQPATGDAYLVLGLDIDTPGPQATEAVRLMMRRSVSAAPGGMAVGTVVMSDRYDPVALWLRARTRPFYDRDALAGAGGSAHPLPPPLLSPDGTGHPGHGYGYPRLR